MVPDEFIFHRNGDRDLQDIVTYLDPFSPMNQSTSRDLNIFFLPFFATFEGDFNGKKEKSRENATRHQKENTCDNIGRFCLDVFSFSLSYPAYCSHPMLPATRIDPSIASL